jgi:hypothetical protein
VRATERNIEFPMSVAVLLVDAVSLDVLLHHDREGRTRMCTTTGRHSVMTRRSDRHAVDALHDTPVNTPHIAAIYIF